MKRLITLLICLSLILFTIIEFDTITNKIITHFTYSEKIAITNKNKYAKEKNYEYVQITKDFIPYSYQDLLNIFYTVLDSGLDEFTFFCPSEYEKCISDVNSISTNDNNEILTTLGNYVSPFNNFKSIKVKSSTTGEVNIFITHLYADNQITNINNKIDSIYKEIIKDTDTKENIIKKFHDYIINNTKYDVDFEKELEKLNNGEISKTAHSSNTAIGPLFEGYAICSGYTDAMALVLDRLNIENYKIASVTHVWNAVNLNNKWLHIDLTWDDPVTTNNTDTLLDKFYLINTKDLNTYDIKEHEFDKSVYIEAK